LKTSTGLIESLETTDTFDMRMDELRIPEECRLDEKVWRGLEYLESVAGPGAVAEMIDHFGQDMPDRIRRMRAMLEGRDFVVLARLAHDLKSNSATLGVPSLSKLGYRLEQVVERGDTENATVLIDEIERLSPQVCMALERRGASFRS
jgi:HPt (histidine-containing phosphotransfer) domain-containing protein